MSRPNFILFVTDQHRAAHLGCYGDPIVRTPNIDALAAGGTRFERFYVASPVCMPNRASLMTGRLPSAHLVRHNGVPLASQATTFVELLKAAGYHTGLVGKSHLQNMTGTVPQTPARFGPEERDDPPEALADAWRLGLEGPDFERESARAWREDPDRVVSTPFYGYDEVRLCSNHGDQVDGHYTAWLRDHAEIPQAQLVGPENAIPDDRYVAPQAWRTRVPEALYPTSYIAGEAVGFLQRRAERGDESPFMLTVSFPDPHHPFTPPGRYWDMYDPASIPLPRTFDDKLAEPLPPVPELRAALLNESRESYVPVKVTEREAREAIALTYGMITMIDDAVGRVLAVLEASGASEDTVIAFTADHGDYMGERGVLFKFGLHYQELVRVPFIWRDPARPADAAVAERLASTIDIGPTILARAGLNPAFGTQGLDIADPRTARDAVLIEDHAASYYTDPSAPGFYTSMVTDRWRMTRYESCDWGELFDLQNDPEERTNLWEDPAHASVRAALGEQLVREMLRMKDRGVRATARA